MIPELDLDRQNTDTNGYMYVYQPNHPMASGVGKVYVHRYVMAKHLNRMLESNEHVHHKDENKTNNDITNLELLNSSIHARLHHIEQGKSYSVITKVCSNCGTSFQLDHKRRDKPGVTCSDFCRGMFHRKFNISKEELQELVWSMPTTEVAKIYGVSDKAIEKRCKLLGVNKPPRGYWIKVKAGKIQKMSPNN